MALMRVNGANIVTERNSRIIDELLADKSDPVHSTKGMCKRDFIATRLGHSEQNKQCYITLRPEHKLGNVVNASLYIALQTNEISDERDFNGDIANILETPVSDLIAEPTAAIFYSIASFPESTIGAGAALINEMCDRFKDKNVKLSTLSPLRGFSRWLDTQMNQTSKTEIYYQQDRLKEYAVQYLLTFDNPVQRFHMKKMGAYIGDIKLNCNRAGSADHMEGMNVMVNYAYGSSVEREFNRSVAAAGNMIFASHLHDIVRRVSRKGYAQVPEPKPSHPWMAKPVLF